MKKIFIIILGLLAAIQIQAQEENETERWRLFKKNKGKKQEIQTLIKKRSPGGYWSINAGYTQIANEDALVFGTTFSYIANRILEVGISGQGIFSNNPMLGNYGNKVAVGAFYGGLHVAPVLFSNKAVHFTFPVLIGGGAGGYYDYKAYEEFEIEDYDWDALFVIEPGVNVELNISRFLRLGIGGKYRFTNKVEIDTMDENAFKGFTGGLTLKVGKF